MKISANYSVNSTSSGYKRMKATTKSSPAFMSSGDEEKSPVLSSTALANLGIYKKSRINNDDIKNYIDGRKDIKAEVKEIVNNHPEIIGRLLKLSNPNGSQFFNNEYEIVYKVLSVSSKTLLSNPQKVFAVLENTEEVASLRCKRPGCLFGKFSEAKFLWAIKHPLDSTRNTNPGVFEPEEAVNKESVMKSILALEEDYTYKEKGIKLILKNPELIEKLASLKDSSGHILLDSEEIASFLINFADHENRSYMRNLYKIINNPETLKNVEEYGLRSLGLYTIVTDR